MQFGSGLVLEAVGLVWCSLIDEHTTSWFGVVLVWILHHYQIELNVLGHDRPLGVDGAQVGVLEQTHQICLCSLLQGKHCMALEMHISLHKYTGRGYGKFLVILQNCGTT